MVSALESEKATWKADVFEKGMDITNKVIAGHKEAQDTLNERLAAQEGVIETLRGEVQRWRDEAGATALVSGTPSAIFDQPICHI